MRRIHVIGTSGSGKSTVAQTLVRKLGLAHIELDALHWLPGWEERPAAEFRAEVERAVQGEGWVVDGNYNAKVRDLVWPRVDTVVWLDLPRSTVMRQVTARTFQRWWKGDLLWGTNHEDLRTTLLSRDSVLWWAWTSHAPLRAKYEQLLVQVPFEVVRLRTTAEVDRWLEGI